MRLEKTIEQSLLPIYTKLTKNTIIQEPKLYRDPTPKYSPIIDEETKDAIIGRIITVPFALTYLVGSFLLMQGIDLYTNTKEKLTSIYSKISK